MKHDEFQVKGHRFENEIKIDSLDQWLICMTTRALLRVNLRGAFFVLKNISRQSTSGKQWITRTTSQSPRLRETLATVAITRENSQSVFSLVLEENIMDKNYKPIKSMKEVPEQLRKLRRQYLRYQQAEIIYSISHQVNEKQENSVRLKEWWVAESLKQI